MRVLNFGSLNIDYVYRVPHFVKPGETLSSTSFNVFSGGKGANQSVALAKAKAAVSHAGKVGKEGKWLADKLAGFGVDIESLVISDKPTGHAIIFVNDQGQNSIVLFAGANKEITRDEIKAALDRFTPGDILLLQNEINEIPFLIEDGHARGLKVFFNPAPFDASVARLPLQLVDTLVLNEVEAEGLTGKKNSDAALADLTGRYPQSSILLTLGEEGVLFGSGNTKVRKPAQKVKVVDTTAAGDTFLGYYIAALLTGKTTEECLEIAGRAAAICVSRPGASDSIPVWKEVVNK